MLVLPTVTLKFPFLHKKNAKYKPRKHIPSYTMYVDLLSSSLMTTDASPPPLLIVTNDKSFWELLKLIVKDSESLSVTSLLVMLMNTDTDVVFAGNNMSLLTGIKSETGGGGGGGKEEKSKERERRRKRGEK